MSTHLRTSLSCLFLSGLLALGQADALAQSSSEAEADALFMEGKELRDAGQHAAACDRFQKSQKLDPALGTLQNIGMCLEKQDKLIAALQSFEKLLVEATKASDNERLRVAQEALKRLQKTIPRLQIYLREDSRVPGLEILLNGEPVPKKVLGISAPLDPGRYVISARAPDYQRQSKTVVLVAEQNRRVNIPKLRLLEAEDTTREDAPPVEEDDDTDGSIVSDADTKRAVKRARSIGASVGPSFFTIGEEKLPTQPAFAIETAWRLRSGDGQVEAGGLLSATAFSWTYDGRTTTTQLLSLVGNLTYSRKLSDKMRLRMQGGLGILFLFGLGEVGHPFLPEGYAADWPVNLAHLRFSFGLEYELKPRFRLTLSPLVAWFSPRTEVFDDRVGNLGGTQSMLGVNYMY
jgi:hypothetical protein